MSLRRQLGVSFAVQGAGAAAVLLATVWLGAALGPEVQGGFSQAKSALEFVAALALFGLPQALFYFVKSGAMGAGAALRWALGASVLALPIGVAAAWCMRGPGFQVSADAFWPAAMALGLAVAALVAHGQLRVLLLVRDRTLWFNLLTALPQLLALVGVGVVISGAAFGGPMPVPPAAWWSLFATVYAVGAVLAWRRLRSAVVERVVASSVAASVRSSVGSSVGWRALGHYGSAAWLTAVLASAAVFAAQRHVEALAGSAALGRFTLAMTLVQVPLTPIAYAAPLLLRRWMEPSRTALPCTAPPGARDALRWAGALFGGLIAAAALVACFATVWPDFGLGAAYAGVTLAVAVLLTGAAAEAASRVLTVQASARGLPWVGVRAELARWGVLALGAALPLPAGLLPLCAVWTAGAIAAALVFVLHARAPMTRGAWAAR